MNQNKRPTREEAQEAVKTIIRWLGDNPERESLKDTPARVVRAYEEYFRGYKEADIETMRCFNLPIGFDDVIQLHNIRLESFCEHHLAPIIGNVSIAYYPDKEIIGLSKLARIVDLHAKKLQIQERLVVEIAATIEQITKPKGVAVVIDASHHCLTTRGAHKVGSIMRTVHFSGCFKEAEIRKEFIDSIGGVKKND